MSVFYIASTRGTRARFGFADGRPVRETDRAHVRRWGVPSLNGQYGWRIEERDGRLWSYWVDREWADVEQRIEALGGLNQGPERLGAMRRAASLGASDAVLRRVAEAIDLAEGPSLILTGAQRDGPPVNQGSRVPRDVAVWVESAVQEGREISGWLIGPRPSHDPLDHVWFYRGQAWVVRHVPVGQVVWTAGNIDMSWWRPARAGR